MKCWILVFLTVLAATPCQAGIFKWRLPDGSIEYSDRPPEKGAERVELPPLTTYSPPAPSTPGAAAGGGAAAAFDGYDSFTIASPANNATVRDNAGNVNIRFDISPRLVEGHAIEIFLDGQKFGRVGTPLLTLANVSRGFHQIHATIVDDGGAELARTETINIVLQNVAEPTPDPQIAAPQAPRPTYPAGARSPGGPASPGGPTPGFGAPSRPPQPVPVPQ